MAFSFLIVLLVIVPVFGSAAFLTLSERKILAGGQRRAGTKYSGVAAILGCLSDGLKIVRKNYVSSKLQVNYLFIFSLFSLIISLLLFIILVPSFLFALISTPWGLLAVPAIGWVWVFFIVFIGIVFGKFWILGSSRLGCQFVWYDVLFTFLMSCFIFLLGADFDDIASGWPFCIKLYRTCPHDFFYNRLLHFFIDKIFLYFLPANLFLIFFIIFFLFLIIFEVGRIPADLHESEGELAWRACYRVWFISVCWIFFDWIL